MPPQTLAVAETRLRGRAGRVGAGLLEVRASPEMRPGSHVDWAATPQASLSHKLRRRRAPKWLLLVTEILRKVFATHLHIPRNPFPIGVSTSKKIWAADTAPALEPDFTASTTRYSQ